MQLSDIKLYAGIYIDLQENLTFEDKTKLLEFVQEGTEAEVINLLVTGEMKSEENINNTEIVYEAFSATSIPFILSELPDVINTTKQYWTKTAQKAATKALDTITGVKRPTMYHTKAYRVPKSLTTQAKEAGKSAYDWLVKRATEVKANPDMISGLKIGAAAAVAALAIFIGRKIYKQYLSKMARVCAKEPDKDACIRKAKVAALSKQIQAIKSNMDLCNRSKNPAKCKAQVQQQINKKKSQIQKILVQKKAKV